MWIDCLCIIQNDASDWETEASKMGIYFREAHITIAATASKDACSGIFTQRTEYLDSHAIEIEDDEGVVQILDTQRSPDLNDVFGNIGVLGERAWAFQENILSRRVAHFTKAGVIWECGGSILFEDGWPPVGFDGLKSYTRAPQSLLSCWGKVVNAYSRRKLTFAEDKLPALSGIAAMMSGTSWGGCRYVAGMWEETLPYDLIWRTSWGKSLSRVPGLIKGPSWTWASIDAPITYSPFPMETATNMSVILNTNCVPQGRNPFAGFVEGCIEIEGPVTRATVTFEGNKNSFELGLKNTDDTNLILHFEPDTLLDVDESRAGKPHGLPGLRRVNRIPKPFEAELACLWICTSRSPSSSSGSTYGLGITEMESRPGYFTRLGLVQFMFDSQEPWRLDPLPDSRRRVCLV
ncbi:Protein-lysine N-methyltransferase efm5 [Hypoxylon texense]